MLLDKTLPPSTPVKKGATPKVSEVNLSQIESTPSNLLKKSLLRKAMADETNKEQTPKSVLHRSDNDAPLVKENSGARTSPRTSPKAIAATPEVKTPAKKAETPKNKDTPKSTKKIAETPRSSRKV